MCVNLITIPRIWGGGEEGGKSGGKGGGEGREGGKWQKVYLPNYHLFLPGEEEEWKAANNVVYIRVHKQSSNYISLTTRSKSIVIKVTHSAGRILANTKSPTSILGRL